MTDVGTVNVKLGGDASGAMSALNQVSDGLSRVAEIAGGIVIGEAIFSGLERLQSLVEGVLESFIDVNNRIEQFTVSMGVFFDNAAKFGTQADTGTKKVSTGVANAADAIQSAQQRMADAASDHALALSRISAEAQKARDTLTATLSQLASQYQASLADLSAAHEETLAKLSDDEAKTTASFNEQLDARTASFNAAMQSLQESHERTIQNLTDGYQRATAQIQEQLAKLTATFETESLKRQQAMADELDKTPDSYEQQRKSATASIVGLTADLTDAQARGDTDLVAALQRRIAEERATQNESYDQYVAAIRAKQDAEKKSAQDAYNTQVAALQKRLADEKSQFDRRIAEENQSYAERSARLQEQYSRDVAHLKESLTQQMDAIHQRIGDEQKAYEKAVEDKKKTYDKDVANAKQAEQDKLAAVQQRLDDENRMYARQERDAAEALAKAQRHLGEAETTGGKANRFSGPQINELPQERRDLEAMVGHPLKTGEDVGAAMESFIEQSTFGTPFNADQLRPAVQRLTGFQLSATKWMKTITDTAAAVGQSPEFIASLLGRISTGEGGRAIYEFAQLGVPLQKVKGLDFTNQGMLTTSPAEALPVIQEELNKRFQGMGARQARTLPGIESNFQDLGLIFSKLAGGPLQKDLEGELSKIFDWLTKNTGAVQKLADSVGSNLDRVWKALQPDIDKIATALEGWLTSGQAEKDIGSFTDSVIKLIPEAAQFLDSVTKLADQMKPWLPLVEKIAIAFVVFLTVIVPILVSLASLVTVISGIAAVAPTVIGAIVGIIAMITGVGEVALVVAAIVVALAATWTTNMFGIRDIATTVWHTISDTIQALWVGIVKFFDVGLPQFGRTVQQEFNAIRDAIKLAFLEAQLGIENTLNAMLTFIQNFVNGVIDRINALISGMLGKINAVLSAANKATIDFKAIQHVSFGLLDTGDVQAAINAIQQPSFTISPSGVYQNPPAGQSIDYNQLAGALARQPITVQMDGKTVAQLVRQQLINTGRRNGNIFGGLA